MPSEFPQVRSSQTSSVLDEEDLMNRIRKEAEMSSESTPYSSKQSVVIVQNMNDV